MKLFSRIIHQRLALSPQLDLPIALGMLKLEENNRLPALDAFCITGELALSGRLRAVKGVLSITLEAKRRCRQTLSLCLWRMRRKPPLSRVWMCTGQVRCLKSSISARRNLLEPVRSTNDWTEAKFGDQEGQKRC